MMSYRSLLVIPLVILLGCKPDPFREADLFQRFQSSDNGLWGYADPDGKILIEAKYEEADKFRVFIGGVKLTGDPVLASVKLNGKWGFINTKDKVVIPLKYDEISSWVSGVWVGGERTGPGYYLIRAELNGKYGFINFKDEVVIPLIYSNKLRDSEGLAAAELNGKWGFINMEGKVVIPFKYDHAEAFERVGLAEVIIRSKYNPNGSLRSVERWGWVDKKGNEYWMDKEEALKIMWRYR